MAEETQASSRGSRRVPTDKAEALAGVDPTVAQEPQDQFPPNRDTPPPAPAAPQGEQEYEVRTLLIGGTDYPAYVVAGALSGRDPEDKLTIAQANDAAQQWLASPINPVDGDDADDAAELPEA